MITTMNALESRKPGAEWVLTDDKLEWLDTKQTEPTQEEIDAEIKRLQDQYDANEYQRSRALEYPSIADQLDEIYHNGVDSWKAIIKQTKDKYPKG